MSHQDRDGCGVVYECGYASDAEYHQTRDARVASEMIRAALIELRRVITARHVTHQAP